MRSLIAEYIDKAITLIASALFLKYYFSPKMPRFYKKKWVIVISCFLLIYSIIGVTRAYLEYADQRLPSKEELQEKIIANNTIVEKDFTFNSSDGYSLIIPSGYAYTVLPTGAMSVTAIKEKAQSVIAVAKFEEKGSIEQVINGMHELMKKKNRTYSFTSKKHIKISGYDAVRIDLDVEKQGVPTKGIIVLLKGKYRFYQLIMSCPSSAFLEEKTIYEKVITSLKLS